MGLKPAHAAPSLQLASRYELNVRDRAMHALRVSAAERCAKELNATIGPLLGPSVETTRKLVFNRVWRAAHGIDCGSRFVGTKSGSAEAERRSVDPEWAAGSLAGLQEVLGKERITSNRRCLLYTSPSPRDS